MSKSDEGQEQLNDQNTTQTQDLAMDSFFTNPVAASTSSISALQGSIPSGNQDLDPITEAIREQILKKQREQIGLYLSSAHPELKEYTEDDEKFRKFLANLNNQQRGFVDGALNNEKVKAELENIELAGYRNIHSTFSADKYPGGFKPMEWSVSAEDQKREQVVKNGVGSPICTLTETTHNTKPMTIQHNGQPVTINSYRTIDFPVTLDDNASGTMHLSLVARDKDGNAPPIDKAVYFTAHYEASPPPDGIPKLKEVSSPQPLKFLGEGKDALGYIEHGGEIYTLPVTKGNYEAMMKEVAINQGQSIDVSQTIAEDLIKQQEQSVIPQARTLEANSEEIPSISPTQVREEIASKPLQPAVSPTSKSQQAESTGMPNQAVKVTTELSQAMQDLLKNLENTTDSQKQKDLITDTTKKALEGQNAKANVNDLANGILNSKIITQAKLEGVDALLDTVKESSIVDKTKAEIFADTSQTALKTNALDEIEKQGVIAKTVASSLSLEDQANRENAIEGITKNVLDSDVTDQTKAKIAQNTAELVAESDLDSQNKAGIAKIMAKTITEHDMPPATKATIMEATEMGIAGSKAILKDKELMTEGLVEGIYESKAEPELKTDLTKAVSIGVDKSTVTSKEKTALQAVVNKTQEQLQQSSDKIIEQQAKEKTISEVDGVLANPAFNAIAKAAAIKDVTTKVLDGVSKPEIKGEIVQKITKTVANSSLEGSEKADIIKGVGTAVADHNTITLEDKKLLVESIATGIANSNAVLEQKQKMTEGLVNGIYDNRVSSEVQPSLTESVINGVNKSNNITPEDKNTLKETARSEEQNIVLERGLNQNFQDSELGQGSEQAGSDLYKATQGVADALKGVLDPSIKALEQSKKKEELQDQEIYKQETSEKSATKIVDISIEPSQVEFAHPAENLRNILSNLKPVENTKVEIDKQSEQKINKLVENYRAIDEKYKSQYEQQGASYNLAQELQEKKDFVEKAGLSEEDKTKLLSASIKYERENNASKPGVNDSVKMLTEKQSNLEDKVAEKDKASLNYSQSLKPDPKLGISIPKKTRGFP